MWTDTNYKLESIAVSGSTVFTSGWKEVDLTHRESYYSKNTAVTKLQAGSWSMAYGITLSGSDFYVAGFSGSAYNNVQACYWKNGALHNLPGSSAGKTSHGYSIAVKNRDVYVAGSTDVYFNLGSGESTSSACYWKNNTRIILQSGNASANGIFVVQR